MLKKSLLIFGWIILILLLIDALIGVFVVLPIKPSEKSDVKLGVTFSIRAAEYLELNWRQTYRAILDDLQPEVIRLPIYWNTVEPIKDDFVWDDFDYQLALLQGKKTKAILAIGHKLPRWPECHLPDWTNDLSEEEIKQQLMEMLEVVVNRYKNDPSLLEWQVENEALFEFGDCPDWSNDRQLLKKEIKLVKLLDPVHTVTTSDSGELSSWLKTSTLPIDGLNISLYRTAYTEQYGYFYWPVNPYFYKLHSLMIRPFVKNVTISELQMEPWGPKSVRLLNNEDINRSFNPENFKERFDFAKATGSSMVLAWGVEWWYYMKEARRNVEYWNHAVESFNSND